MNIDIPFSWWSCEDKFLALFETSQLTMKEKQEAEGV